MIYRRGIAIRAVAASVFGSLFVMIWLTDVGQAIPGLLDLLLILLGLLVVNPLLWLIGEYRNFPLDDFRWHWTMDVAAVTGAVYYLGALDFPLSATAYMIMIVSSGTFASMGSALYLATWSTACFLGVVGIEAVGVLPHQHVEFAVHPSPQGTVVVICSTVLLFYVFGYLGGTLASQLREKAMEVLEQKGELEEAYAKQAFAKESMELLSALVQHDVYGPLGVISGASQEAVAACSEGDLQGAARFVGMIENRLRSIEGAVATLSLLARSDIGTSDGSGHSLEDIVSDLLEDLRIECRERRVQVTTVGNEGWPIVRLRREELYHVLRNLVTNSVKVVRDDGTGRVVISAARVDAACELRVEDNGPGIPEEVAERVLQTASWKGLGQRKPEGGFGVGLTLCSRIVRNWGGSIKYSARKEGGALFAITIPARWVDWS